MTQEDMDKVTTEILKIIEMSMLAAKTHGLRFTVTLPDDLREKFKAGDWNPCYMSDDFCDPADGSYKWHASDGCEW